MPTHQSSFPLHHSPTDKGYRLIELPPELQSLLESPNPPVLTLESSESSALLKCPHGTYSLRQKNTSNSVVLLSCRPPAITHLNNTQDEEMDVDKGNIIELAAISTIKETVELHPLSQHVDMNTEIPPPSETKSKGKWHQRFGSSR